MFISSCRPTFRTAVQLLILVTSTSALATTPWPIEVRDSRDGQFIEAKIRLIDAAGQSRQWQWSPGQTAISVEPGSFRIEVDTPGHEPLVTNIVIDDKGALAHQFWLDPITPASPRELDEDPTRAWIEGRLFDRKTRQVLAGAEVRIDDQVTISDPEGRFAISLVLPQEARENGKAVHLQVKVDGQPAWQQALRAVPGRHHLPIDIDFSLPPTRIDHHLDGDVLQWPADEDVAEHATPAERAPILVPPTSLSVGFADAGFTTPCCVGSCSAVAVMSLETYVKRGLNDEWIASWNAHSLRAGAIAYRSYGAWHVEHPRNANYDICSSACCQMNDPDTSGSTNAAVDATAGILLERNGAIFRSEYSAENNAWDDPGDGLSCSNNDLSCGDGAVGSPANNWPCLVDTVAQGHGCFGHGRGMSQWGSQRWAANQAQRWPWIVNHYFNANGAGDGLRDARISSPLRIDSFSPVPSTVAAGATLSIQIDASNLAALSHTSVFLGASLYRSGFGYIDDPTHDLGVMLDPGANQVARPFQVPFGTPDGSYDLIVALYLDIDDNAALNSGDLALTSSTLTNAVSVSTPALIFANGFETSP